MAMIGYARCSTEDQDSDSQAERLTNDGCERVFTDHGVSGKLRSRPQLDACLAFLRHGDALMITKLDRLGRSVLHLREVADKLSEDGIELACMDQPIDTRTPSGRLFYTMLSAFAEFEREMISERTRDGLRATKARGRSGGRPAKLAPYQVVHAQSEIDSGRSVLDVARDLGVDRATLYRALRAKG